MVKKPNVIEMLADAKEAKRIIDEAYHIFGDALDAIQNIVEMPHARIFDIRDGVKAIADHSRNLLGLERK